MSRTAMIAAVSLTLTAMLLTVRLRGPYIGNRHAVRGENFGAWLNRTGSVAERRVPNVIGALAVGAQVAAPNRRVQLASGVQQHRGALQERHRPVLGPGPVRGAPGAE